jgi:hypothetical protein
VHPSALIFSTLEFSKHELQLQVNVKNHGAELKNYNLLQAEKLNLCCRERFEGNMTFRG